MFSSEKIEHYCLWGTKGILFLIAFLPLYVTPWMVFPYITGKNFAFRILIEFAAVLWLGLITIDKKYRPLNSPLTLSILIFTFIVGLADLTGVNPYKSFWSNYERMEGYITILHLALYFLIVKSVLRSKKDWAVMLNIIVAVSALVSIYAFLASPQVTDTVTQFTLEYGTRIRGTIGNPPFLATYLLLACFFGFILIADTKRLYLKFIYSLPIIVNSIAIYFTSSRGAILGAIIGLFIFTVLLFLGKSEVPRKKLVKKGILLCSALLVTFSMVYFIFTSSGIVKQDRTLTRFVMMFSDPSVITRLDTWKIAWEGIKEKPILGWGQENFIAAYTVNSIPLVDEQIWLDRAHNIVIEWLFSAGILGLFSYLTIFVSVYYSIRVSVQKKIISENLAFLLFTGFAVYFLNNFFTFDTISSYLLFFTALAYVENIVNTAKPPGAHECNNLKKTIRKPLYVILPALIVFLLGFYHIHFSPMKVSHMFIKMARIQSDLGSYSALLDDFNNVLSTKTFDNTPVMYAMRAMSDNIIRFKHFRQKGALDVIKRTADEFKKEISLNRYNLKYLSDMISFYKAIAVYEPSYIEKTHALIKESIRLNPQYHWLYMALSDVYVLKKDYQGAFTNVKKVADMNSEYDKIYMKLALAGIYVSRDDVVRNSLENVTKIRIARNENIASGRKSVLSPAELYQMARVYLEMNNADKALYYYEELIGFFSNEDKFYSARDLRMRHPKKRAVIHYEAAKLYSATDNREKALEGAQKAMELDPENYTEKAEKFISSLTK